MGKIVRQNLQSKTKEELPLLNQMHSKQSKKGRFILFLAEKEMNQLLAEKT